MPDDQDRDNAPPPRDEEQLAALLARFEPAIVGRCVVRLKGSLDAEDVAQDVRLRLLEEVKRGKTYGDLPYRVVVHQVIGWTIADYFAGRRTDVPLPEGWEPASSDDPADEIVSRGWVEWVVSQVEGQDGVVFRMRYVALLEPAQIAEKLGMTPNAVYQALHRCHAKVRRDG